MKSRPQTDFWQGAAAARDHEALHGPADRPLAKVAVTRPEPGWQTVAIRTIFEPASAVPVGEGGWQDLSVGTPGAERVSDALEPFLPWGPPTDEFRLYTGPISFVPTDGDALPPAPECIDLLLRGGSHLNWSVDLDGLNGPVRDAWEHEVRATATGEITFDLLGCPTTLPAHALSNRSRAQPGRFAGHPWRHD